MAANRSQAARDARARKLTRPVESEGFLVEPFDQARDTYLAARRSYVESVKETDRLEKIIKDAREELTAAKAARADWARTVAQAKSALARALDAEAGLTLPKSPDTDSEIPEE